jgi:hypothetical protein
VSSVKDMLESKVSGLDIFSQARTKSESLMSAPSDIQENPLDVINRGINDTEEQQLTPEKQNLQQALDTTEVLSEKLVAKPTKKDREKFSASNFSKYLSDNGFPELGKGLSLTSMGRIQLIGRLKDKFGPNFMGNPQAFGLLKNFEKALNKNSEDSRREEKRLFDQATRTAQYLLGE